MPLLCPCPFVGSPSPRVQALGEDSCFRNVSWGQGDDILANGGRASRGLILRGRALARRLEGRGRRHPSRRGLWPLLGMRTSIVSCCIKTSADVFPRTLLCP